MKNIQTSKILIRNLENLTTDDLFEIKLKLSMPDSTIQIRNSRFYLPNYPVDLIQHEIVAKRNYWEYEQLSEIDKHLKDNAVIIDVGANIGNHSLYWAMERHAKKIYAFEPIESTYEILERNIQLNHLEDVIQPYNLGLSDEETFAKIKDYNISNIGGTELNKAKWGQIKLVPLDSLSLKRKIDVIKIDVEESEADVLIGATKTIQKNKPLIIIESFSQNKAMIDVILKELKYKQIEQLTDTDFIYKYIG